MLQNLSTRDEFYKKFYCASTRIPNSPTQKTNNQKNKKRKKNDFKTFLQNCNKRILKLFKSCFFCISLCETMLSRLLLFDL